ncbi:DUF2937 family protein [Cognatiyoonia sp.]|uniref:DUF2937 family protein n=1 Tax=Cognatiyoonia sp. TaxID=2211652 RepID=UPI003F6A0D83
MIKTISLAAGVAGAVAASQYPAFTQQYIQRLGGQVDALSRVVSDFDNSALEAGLGRDAALLQMTGTEFLTFRQSDMRATFRRHADLTDHLAILNSATPMARLTMPHRIADAETFAATWDSFSPAIPVTRAGALATGVGGFLGFAVVLSVLSAFARPFRRKPAPRRLEPVISR